jgi:hypothetical protein
MTASDAGTLTMHSPPPEHAPAQPVNLLSGVWCAVSFTRWFACQAFWQCSTSPHLIPGGSLMTTPLPTRVALTA